VDIATGILDLSQMAPFYFVCVVLLLICSLICRGSKPSAVDNVGKTPLECAVEKGGAITDEELFIMLSETSR